MCSHAVPNTNNRILWYLIELIQVNIHSTYASVPSLVPERTTLIHVRDIAMSPGKPR